MFLYYRLDKDKSNKSLLHLTTTSSSLRNAGTCVTFDPPRLHLPVGFYQNKVGEGLENDLKIL